MLSNAILVIDESQERNSIELRESDGFKGVFAKEDIPDDAVIFYLRGTISTQPTKYTIQLGNRRHLSFPTVRKPDDGLDYCWQYLNHSCEPNGYINTNESTFRALRDIVAGEEISFNYLTTESEMAVPFECTCGSANCFGFIRGRNFLTPTETMRLSLAVGEDKVVRLFMPAVPKRLHSVTQRRRIQKR